MHYASDQSFDFLEIFNQTLKREFLSNDDYQRVGGQDVDEDDDYDLENEDDEMRKPPYRSQQ